MEELRKKTEKFTFDEKKSLENENNKSFIIKLKRIENGQHRNMSCENTIPNEKVNFGYLKKAKKTSANVSQDLNSRDTSLISIDRTKNKSSSVQPLFKNTSTSVNHAYSIQPNSPVKSEAKNKFSTIQISPKLIKSEKVILPKLQKKNTVKITEEDQTDPNEIIIPKLNLSPNILENENENNLPHAIDLREKRGSSHSDEIPTRRDFRNNWKRRSLMKLYNQDNIFSNKLSELKNDRRFRNECTLEEYQQKIFDVVKDSLSNNALQDLSNKFKDINKISSNARIKKIRISKWTETGKRIRHIIPEYLVEKFNNL